MSAYLQPDGIWFEVRQASVGSMARKTALFLDRDGVIVEEVNYLHRPHDAKLIEGAAAVIAEANRSAVPVILATNQSGIGRGYYGWSEFQETQDAVVALLAESGAALDAVLACPHHAEAEPPYRHARHPCRKPEPGMLLKAAESLNLDLHRSWIVGDRASDLEAGRAAGLSGGLHVLTGHGREDRFEAEGLATSGFPVRLADSIAAAAGLPILS